MHFTIIVGNPPYQSETMDSSGRKQITNIFQHYYHQANTLADNVSMIFPGGRWMNRQSKLRDTADYILSTANNVIWYPNGAQKNTQSPYGQNLQSSRAVIRPFEDAVLADGISIVSKLANRDSFTLNGVIISRPKQGSYLPLTRQGAELVNKVNNVLTTNNSIHNRKLGAAFFGLRSNWVEQNQQHCSLITDKNVDNPPFADRVKAFLSDDNPVAIAKRVKEYWVDADAINWNQRRTIVYKKYKVVAPSVLKEPTKVTFSIVDNEHIVGESWVILGAFDTEQEANNYKDYLNTPIVQTLLDESKGGRLGSFGVFVPDLKNYTDDNSLFAGVPNGDIERLNERLIQYFGLD